VIRLLGGLAVTVMALYCAPRGRNGRGQGRGREGSGLYPELAAYRISEGSSPNLQAEVGRLVGQLPIEQARAELTRRGLELDEKAVRRIASELGEQMLATRTRDLLRFRAGTLPAGDEFAGKRVAVEIDGGRVRVRTVIEKTRVSGKKKRRKFRIEWREPKVVILFQTDEKGRMAKGSRPVIDGTLQGPDALIELVAFHLHRLGAAQAKIVTFAADGAPWIWARLDWVIAQVKLEPARVVEVLDWCHGVHHLSLALAALHLTEERRAEEYGRLRTLLRAGQSAMVIAALERLAAGQPEDSSVWREIRYLTRHAEAGRLRYHCFRNRGVPLGSGAIESTIRRVINLRLKGNSVYWTEGNAEAVFQLRAALVSGRWEEIVGRTREAMARDRRTAWQWTPPECLAELKALDEEGSDATQTSTRQRSKRSAA
jgi:PAS domain-containing protein